MFDRRGMAVALVGLTALAAGCASTDAIHTGAIEGRVRLGDAPITAARHTVVTAWPEGAPIPPDTTHGRETADVELAAGRFAPGMQIVSAGTSVTFDNHDRVFHMPFSVSPDGPFELGRCAPGTRHATHFDRPGVIEVFCALHPTEQMYIVVAPDRWHARPTPDGRFAFRNLPLGTWLVRAWSPREGEVTKRVQVLGSSPVVVDLVP
jgi:plastocyanin